MNPRLRRDLCTPRHGRGRAVSESRVVVVDGDRTPERPLLVLDTSPVGVPPAGPRLPVPRLRLRRREGRGRVRYRRERDGGGRVRGVGGGIAALLERAAQDRVGRAVRLLGSGRADGVGDGSGGDGGDGAARSRLVGRLRPAVDRRRFALLRNRRGAPQGRPLTLTVTACAFS